MGCKEGRGRGVPRFWGKGVELNLVNVGVCQESDGEGVRGGDVGRGWGVGEGSGQGGPSLPWFSHLRWKVC